MKLKCNFWSVSGANTCPMAIITNHTAQVYIEVNLRHSSRHLETDNSHQTEEA